MQGLFTDLLITVERKQAQARGWKRYFTGKPCPKGHRYWRLVSTRACTKCCSHTPRKAATNRRWAAANADRMAAHLGAFNARARSPGCVPTWTDLDACEAIYREARRLGLEVDHVVPLVHPLVCGLHVPVNLQLLTRAANRAKGNTFDPG